MLAEYKKHVEERAQIGILPKPLSASQVVDLIELLKSPPTGEDDLLTDLLANRIPPGVDEAAYVKAGFLSAIAQGEVTSPLISKQLAVELLGSMLGGYNISTLVGLLTDNDLAASAADQLCNTLLMFDAFYDVADLAKEGNIEAQRVLHSWADAESVSYTHLTLPTNREV